MSDLLEHFTVNLGGPKVRYGQMEGRDYIVAPMVMLMEGVHRGSNGSLFYSREELGKTPVVWNHKPVVVYHPEINGVGVSACDPSILTAQKVGVIMNTRFDRKSGKLKAEAWMEKERLTKVDARVLTALEAGDVMELSTGLFTDNKAEAGDWNGEKYDAIATNFRPDHLALLPDRIGACSIADGAGLNMNSDKRRKKVDSPTANDLSFSATRSALYSLISAKFGDMAYIEDVYGDFVIVGVGGKFQKIEYTTDSNNVVALSATAVDVVRVTEYRTANGVVIGNVAFNSTKEKEHMAKKERVTALIANTGNDWKEEDRTFLEGMSDENFARIFPEAPAQNTEKKEAPAPAVPAPVTANTQATPAAKPLTADEYVTNAPPGVREVLLHSMSAYNKAKADQIAVITANAANRFTKELLEKKDLPELEAIASLAAKPAEVQLPPNYQGAGGYAPVDNASNPDPLVMPTMNFASKK